MTEHNLFYYSYATFTSAQLLLLKVVALFFDKLVLLGPICASWATIGTDSFARGAAKQLQDAGILQTVTLADKVASELRTIVLTSFSKFIVKKGL